MKQVLAAIFLGCITALPSATIAQSRSIVLSNAGGLEIPLLDGSEVEILGNGQVRAECVLDGAGCAGLGAGGSPPIVSLSAQPVSAEPGQSVSLTWFVGGGAPGACVSRSFPSLPGWDGLVGLAQSGLRSLTFNSPGTYELTITCYTETGFASASAQVEISPPPGVPSTCTASGPAIQPAGYTRVERTWQQVFNGLPTLSSPGFEMPVGSYTLQGAGVAGSYLTVPFQMPAATSRRLDWLPIQPVLALGYFPASVASTALVSISPCPGDFRLPQSGSDPLLSECRALGPKARINFGTSGFGCPLQAGATYYLNVLLDDPQTLTPSSSSCLSGQVCDIGVFVY